MSPGQEKRQTLLRLAGAQPLQSAAETDKADATNAVHGFSLTPNASAVCICCRKHRIGGEHPGNHASQSHHGVPGRRQVGRHLAGTIRLEFGWNGPLARSVGLPARQLNAKSANQMVCDLRALGWAAGCRPERPSWPFHLDQLHRSGLGQRARRPSTTSGPAYACAHCSRSNFAAAAIACRRSPLHPHSKLMKFW